MAFVDHSKAFDGTCATVFWRCLIALQTVDIKTRHIHIWTPIDNPMSEHATNASACKNANGIEARCDKIIL